MKRRLRRYLYCFRRSLAGAYNHGALGFAKGAAYSALLAFFPILTSVTAILAQANAGAVSRTVVRWVFRAAPPGTEEIVRSSFTEWGERPVALLVVAALLALWAASGVMISLMEGFEAAYLVRSRRSVFRKRGVAVWLVLAAILPVVGASSAMVFSSQTERAALRFFGVIDPGETLAGGIRVTAQIVRYLLAAGAIVLATAGLYYFAPDYPRRHRRIWPGCLVATSLWFLITLAFAWYVRNMASYNVLYGSIGAGIALLVWMFLLAVVALVGHEFNVALEKG
jgi:membrane protein